jgi:fermentation-respiration switch protein FrsA (DUF1100 family)
MQRHAPALKPFATALLSFALFGSSDFDGASLSCSAPAPALPGEYWPTGTSIGRLPRAMPVLFLSGREDELVPPAHMDALYERCVSTRKVWKSIERGNHSEFLASQRNQERFAC